MNFEEVIANLEAEREQVVQAITSLELLAERRGPKRERSRKNDPEPLLRPGAAKRISKLLPELRVVLVRLELELVVLRAQKDGKGKEPPLEGAAVPARVPRPRPNLPSATAAAAVPRPELTLAVSDLKSEREQIEEAIAGLERLAHGRGRKRGRPPGANDPGSQPPPAPPAADRIAGRPDRTVPWKKPA